MSYYKSTTISGQSVEDRYVLIERPGHWKQETAAVMAANAGIVGPITIKHHVYDESGLGRSGIVREMGYTVPLTPMAEIAKP